MFSRALSYSSVRGAVCLGLNLLLALLFLCGEVAAQDTVDVLIVNGQSNHDWVQSTAAARGTLLNSGRFNVDVSTSPPAGSPAPAWDGWRPAFSNYDVVLVLYKGEMWPAQVRTDFEAYIATGGGAVIFHAPLATFFPPHLNPGEVEWTEYSNLLGLGWRLNTTGTRVVIDDATNEPVFVPPPLGGSSNHGAQHSFVVKSRRPLHPIMNGVPTEWVHGKDELYHAMRGPAQNLEVLASAFSSLSTIGTGLHEPMLWTVAHGAGRVVTTAMGHRWFGNEGPPGTPEENGADALHCVGFQTLLARSAEWAATGQVTIPVPPAFPAAVTTSIVDPLRGVWLKPVMKVNGLDLPTNVVFVPPGRVQLTLDLAPGLFSEPLDFYFGVVAQGQLVWATSAGVSATPAPLTAFVPAALQNVSILNTDLTLGSSLTFVMMFARGNAVVAYDFITAAAF